MKRIFLATTLSTLACSAPATEAVNCADVERAALAVLLVDGGTGALAPFTNIKVIARNSAHIDSTAKVAIAETDAPQTRALRLLWGRPGVYAVTVTAEGYRTWQSASFETRSNLRCGSVTDTLVAVLSRR